MGVYLTIPGVVESQELESLQREPDGRSFQISLALGDTATELWRAANQGSPYELLVVTLEPSLMLALDDVYVLSPSAGTGGLDLMTATLQAADVRVV